ncbi:hypothetical protein [Fibrobacter sp. UWB10]|uniref:hypothetical protein n=1 Tax=Fibrobacter sp. UWB10 TaxID=1896201 RepID=UPI002403613A|nr:hypothetical protein [Fibrobacter sp. UWB10]SMP50968.1 hypothetical protein SAMN05720465_1841 [Fibrobacter sp. UWB10]
MDLREKPGKVQTFLELMLRFRLIAFVVMVIATVSFVATGWQEIVSLPIGASESFGMWLAETEGVKALWESARYIGVAAIACLVMFVVFGGVRAGIASAVSAVLSFAALYVLGGAESMPLPMFGILALVSLVLFLFVKWSVACALFPFVVSWLFLSGILEIVSSKFGASAGLMWGVHSAFAFACAMAFAVVAGKHLAAGVPQAGALVKAAKQLLVPVMGGALLLVAAITFDMGERNWAYAVIQFVAYAVWFYVFMFSISSFAPWERLRSGSRRVEMKDKKKTPAKKKK